MGAFSDQQEQVCWLAQTTQFLWDRQVEDIIAACEVLGKSCLDRKKAATYFKSNCERMRYDQFRAARYIIGNGTIESACKQIVTHRLKLPGGQWLERFKPLKPALPDLAIVPIGSPFAISKELYYLWLPDNFFLHTSCQLYFWKCGFHFAL